MEWGWLLLPWISPWNTDSVFKLTLLSPFPLVLLNCKVLCPPFIILSKDGTQVLLQGISVTCMTTYRQRQYTHKATYLFQPGHLYEYKFSCITEENAIKNERTLAGVDLAFTCCCNLADKNWGLHSISSLYNQVRNHVFPVVVANSIHPICPKIITRAVSTFVPM